MAAEITTKGNYRLVVAMPKTNDSLTLDSETVPCSLNVQITEPDIKPILTDVTSLTLASEYGFARVQYYFGGSWSLKPGNYEIEIKSRAGSDAVMIRGATVSLEQETTHVTENFLKDILQYWSGTLCLWAGILGLVVCEFKRPGIYESKRPPRVNRKSQIVN